MSAYELYMAVEKKQRKLIRKVNLILLKEWMEGVIENVKERKQKRIRKKFRKYRFF